MGNLKSYSQLSAKSVFLPWFVTQLHCKTIQSAVFLHMTCTVKNETVNNILRELQWLPLKELIIVNTGLREKIKSLKETGQLETEAMSNKVFISNSIPTLKEQQLLAFWKNTAMKKLQTQCKPPLYLTKRALFLFCTRPH